MTDTCGLTHVVITKTEDPNDPFVLHIHGIRENGDKVLVATVDDERPMVAARILRMMRDRGLTLEGIDLTINLDEPEIAYLTMRDSVDEHGAQWTDLECRFQDGQKHAAATFAVEFEAFAEAMYALHPKPDVHAKAEAADKPFRRYVLFGSERWSESGGWNDFVGSFDTLEAAQADPAWTTPSKTHERNAHVVDLKTMETVALKTMETVADKDMKPAAN